MNTTSLTSSFSSQPISAKDEPADIAIVKQGHITQRRRVLNVCERCGRRHARSQKCPALDRECRRCYKKGHFAICCRSRHVNEILTIDVTDRLDYLTNMNVVGIYNMVPTILVTLNSVYCNMEFDIGVSLTVITKETWCLIERPPVRLAVTLKTYGEYILTIMGKCQVEVELNSKTMRLSAIIAGYLERSSQGTKAAGKIRMLKDKENVDKDREHMLIDHGAANIKFLADELRTASLNDPIIQRIGQRRNHNRYTNETFLNQHGNVSSYISLVRSWDTSNVSAMETIGLLREQFARWIVPEKIISDNRPPFQIALSPTIQWFGRALNWKRRVKFESQSSNNSLAILQFLMAYRNTPQEYTTKALAELLCGRRIRTVWDHIRPDM
ncbi:hypothetical protein GJ496_000936 [Pomphorhynchus laevis]|nr:hypothetical protein GJ496_000936 [Pomphorhynchus laevis]